MNNRKETSGARYLSAVWLIREVIRGETARDEIREAALHSYEVVLRTLESDELADSISASGKLPREKIGPAAKKIVEFLLFNGKDNPFVSLGLSPFATREDIHRRWKRLIAIYHPDRHPEEKNHLGEEAAKKINEAYKRAIDIKAGKPNRPSLSPDKPQKYRPGTRRKSGVRMSTARKVFFKDFSRCMPSSIVFLAGVIIMISALISIYSQATSSSRKAPQVKHSRMPSAPTQRKRNSLLPDPGTRPGKGANEFPWLKNNAPEETYLYLLLPVNNSRQVSSEKEGGAKAGMEK